MAFSCGAVSHSVPAGDTSGLDGYPVVPKEQLPKVLIHGGWEQRWLQACLLDCGSAFMKHHMRKLAGPGLVTQQQGTRLNFLASLDYATQLLSF